MNEDEDEGGKVDEEEGQCERIKVLMRRKDTSIWRPSRSFVGGGRTSRSLTDVNPLVGAIHDCISEMSRNCSRIGAI